MDPTTLSALGPLVADNTVTVLMGVALAATCGLRAFLPLFVLNIMAMTGRVELGESFAFMGTWPAMLLFGTATVAEFAGDKLPGVDHLLDSIGVVVRPVAATLAAASVVTHVDPLTACAFGLIGGGATAGGVLAVKAQVRGVTTVVTGGLGNWVVSLVEDALALFTIAAAILVPLVASVAAAGALSAAWVWSSNRRNRTLVTATV